MLDDNLPLLLAAQKRHSGNAKTIIVCAPGHRSVINSRSRNDIMRRGSRSPARKLTASVGSCRLR
jgi:hypothetical protein